MEKGTKKPLYLCINCEDGEVVAVLSVSLMNSHHLFAAKRAVDISVYEPVIRDGKCVGYYNPKGFILGDNWLSLSFRKEPV